MENQINKSTCMRIVSALANKRRVQTWPRIGQANDAARVMDFLRLTPTSRMRSQMIHVEATLPTQKFRR